MKTSSLQALQGGGVSFGDGKKGHIFCACMVGKSVEYTIKELYYSNAYLWDILPPARLIRGIKMCTLKRDVHVMVGEPRRIEKLENKEDSEMEELFWIQRNSLNSELAEEHPLHVSNNLKEADADYEPDEGPGPIDSAEQR
ncbi:hypothetical protein KY284_013117 [Solanum tuberosum]|nr:hypothetical protein KY284_013117 [Solanum tuberosum]